MRPGRARDSARPCSRPKSGRSREGPASGVVPRGPTPRPCKGTGRFSSGGTWEEDRDMEGLRAGAIRRSASRSSSAASSRSGARPTSSTASSSNAGRPAVGVLRGPADRQRQTGHPPHGVAHVQGRLPPLQGDDGPLRAAQGRLGLPRPPGGAGGGEADRHEDQARHRGVRRRRVQPPVPRVGHALRRPVGATHRAPRLLARRRRRLSDDGHRVRRERLVVAEAAARTRPALRSGPHRDVLPPLRDPAVRRGGRPGLRGGRGPERLHHVPGRSSLPPSTRSSARRSSAGPPPRGRSSPTPGSLSPPTLRTSPWITRASGWSWPRP